MKKFTINLNVVRIIAVILVIANHTSPFLSYDKNLDFFVTRVLARIAVPFFLMIIGYFSMERFVNDRDAFIIFVKRIGKLYAISVMLYLPIIYYSGGFSNPSVISIIKLLLIDGALYHLWYFPALIVGASITRFLIKHSSFPFLVIVILYFIGLGGDSYYGLVSMFEPVKIFYDLIFSIFSYTRNGLFLVPMFLYLGYYIKTNKMIVNNNIALVLSFIVFVLESLTIKSMNIARHDSMTVSLVLFMTFLFSTLISKENEVNKDLNTLTTLMYVLHPMVIVIVRVLSKALFMPIVLDNSLIFFSIVITFTLLLSVLFTYIKNQFTPQFSPKVKRVYRQINEENLRHNVREIAKYKQPETEIMAVVKANGYGHGSVTISKILQSMSIKTFAVASLDEAIELRQANIKGDILILGHTPINNLHLVVKHDLIQTIVSYDYALSIQQLKLKKKLKSHIKVNTGMNRLGEDYHQVAKIKEMYEMQHLQILGIFSHLAVADSIELEHIQFTELQIQRFEACIKQLQREGIDVKKKHIQGSYGFSNYPHLKYDYIRMGIMLYGVYSETNQTSMMNLKPVMSLIAKVTTIRTIEAGDTISYGQTFKANHTMKIASVNIGYADGLSRQLSNTNYEVIVHGTKCSIIGRICMDQLIIDVTHVSSINIEDEVIIFGEHNRVELLAKHQNSITNEVLTTLNKRIDH